MSWAPLIAGVAGVCLAAAVVEFAEAGVPRPRRGIGRALLRRVPRLGAPKGLVARVEASGVGLGVGEVMAAKLAGAIVAGGGAFAVATSTAALAAAPLAGWFAPDLVLRSRARVRARAIEAELADVLDLLRVAVGAGLTPWRALGRWGGGIPGCSRQSSARPRGGSRSASPRRRPSTASRAARPVPASTRSRRRSGARTASAPLPAER